MRVTAKVKERTRGRILNVAGKLFQTKGFENTTTRDIAAAAKIGVGTLFNYFPTKEALALALLAGSLEAVRDEFSRGLQGDEGLDERLFAHIATSLRCLRPHRGYVAEVVEKTLGPFTKSSATEEAERLRLRHLETVRELIASNGSAHGAEPSLVTLHLYWTLFLGVLAYWAADESPHQEDTLALLDQSMKLFVNSLSNRLSRAMEVADETTRR